MDIRNFLFHSEYPIDKIIGVKTGNVTVGAYGSGSSVVAHGLPASCLPVGTWSLNADFSTSNDAIESPFDNTIPTATVGVDATNITVSVTNNTGSAKTIYWRVVLLPKPGDTNDYAETSQLADTFVLNTDFNYFKQITEGTSTGGTVVHGLDFIPHVLAWRQQSGKIYQITSANTDNNSNAWVKVNATNVVFNLGSFNTIIYYKVYGDD